MINKIKVSNELMSDEELSSLVSKINNEKNETILDIKPCSKIFKERVFKKILNLEDIKNPAFILNTLNLIKSYNDFNASFFENELIYFSDLADYVDLRINLTEDLSKLQREIAKYFYSLFISSGKAEYTILDQYIELPDFMKSLFCTSDIVTIGGIIQNVKNLNTSEFVQVKNANYYLNNLMSSYAFSNILVSELNSLVKEEKAEKDGRAKNND